MYVFLPIRTIGTRQHADIKRKIVTRLVLTTVMTTVTFVSSRTLCVNTLPGER